VELDGSQLPPAAPARLTDFSQLFAPRTKNRPNPIGCADKGRVFFAFAAS